MLIAYLGKRLFPGSPVSVAWERILADEVKRDEVREFTAYSGRIHYINTLHFRPLQKAALGLIRPPVRPLLDCSTSGINVRDREGVDQPDNRALSPIHRAKSLPSLVSLLEYGATITRLVP